MPIPAQVLLINVDYVKKYTTINGAVDPNIVEPCIVLAQDRWVSPYLGDDLYVKLKTDVSGGGTAGNYTTLLDNYVRICVAWWALVEVIPDLTYKMDNGTIVQRTSEDTTPVPDNVMRDLVNRAQGRAQYYTKRLVEYLCANSSLFPEYSSNQYPERCPRTDVYGQFNYGFSNGNTATSRTGGYTRLSQIP
jgi:hypothetical protein